MSPDTPIPDLLAVITYCLLSTCFLSQTSLAQNKASSTERRYACWGSFGPPVVSAQCPRDTVIQVIRAGLKVQSHGGRCSYNENDCGCEHGEMGCNMANVRDLCMGRSACRLDVTQQYINTDQCRGFSDYMFIDFNCVSVQKNSVADICTNKVDVSETGFIKSPNYPQSSTYKQICQCSLIAEGTGSVELTVLDLHTKECEHNKLLVSTGTGQSNTYCGNSYPQKGLSPKSGQVSLTYESDGKGDAGGFWLQYEAVPPGPVKIQCHLQMREKVATTTEIPLTTTTAKPTTDRYKAMLEARQKAREARQKAARENAQREQAAREARERENRERAESEKQEQLKRQMLAREKQGKENDAQLSEEDKNTPWWWRFTMKTKTSHMTVPTTQKPEVEVEETEAPVQIKSPVLTESPDQMETPDRSNNLRPQHRLPERDPHPVTHHPGKSPHPTPSHTIPDIHANTKHVLPQDARMATASPSDNNTQSEPDSKILSNKPVYKPYPKRRKPIYRKVKHQGTVQQSDMNNILYENFLINTLATTAKPATDIQTRNDERLVDEKPETLRLNHRVQGGKKSNADAVNANNIRQIPSTLPPEKATHKADNVNFRNSDDDDGKLDSFRYKYNRMFPSSTHSVMSRPILVRVTPTLLAVPVSPTRAGLEFPALLHPTLHKPALNGSSKASPTQLTTQHTSTTDTAYSHARNGGRPASSNYASNNGLHGNELQKDNPPEKKEEPMTVTIIAACVIGSILLIIIIGIVVRFVINRQDPHYAMRQNHKKECVMRHNAKPQRKGF